MLSATSPSECPSLSGAAADGLGLRGQPGSNAAAQIGATGGSSPEGRAGKRCLCSLGAFSLSLKNCTASLHKAVIALDRPVIPLALSDSITFCCACLGENPIPRLSR